MALHITKQNGAALLDRRLQSQQLMTERRVPLSPLARASLTSGTRVSREKAHRQHVS